MERALFRRDRAYDGIFVAGVRTTNIFCRPTCPAKKPKPENVRYFATAREALFAGFRPCRRCRPMDVGGAPEWVRPLLDAIDAAPDGRIRDAALRRRGLEPARVRRHFQKTYGMTFQAYCRARRLGGALGRIREGGSIDDAVFDHGYSSHSGFRAAFHKLFGIPPGRSQTMKTVAVTRLIESPLGTLLAGATPEGVCLLEYSDRRQLERQLHNLGRVLGGAAVPGTNPHLAHLERELAEYFAGQLRRFTVPLVFPGSPFQRAVWEQLLRIPYGETRSYQDLARRVGKPGASRAVGNANGCNRIAIVIPCHRVVNQSGALGGYGGGKWRKEWLLGLERRAEGRRTQPVQPRLFAAATA
jgi:AraC family transcriptional regulator of adaptative response/methylated-DNA-[protein]-cysteine methyltransferase